MAPISVIINIIIDLYFRLIFLPGGWTRRMHWSKPGRYLVKNQTGATERDVWWVYDDI